jgi:hypothetical protein
MNPLGARTLGWSLRGAAFAAVLAASVAVGGERINKDAEDLAILGYDPVAYFTNGQPVEGNPGFEHVWQDARWRFATAEHRAMFVGDPDRYAPRFGGFCTGGVGLGRLSPIDPEAWVIVDGRLYLHYDKAAQDKTVANPAARISAAEANWAALSRNR